MGLGVRRGAGGRVVDTWSSIHLFCKNLNLPSLGRGDIFQKIIGKLKSEKSSLYEKGNFRRGQNQWRFRKGLGIPCGRVGVGHRWFSTIDFFRKYKFPSPGLDDLFAQNIWELKSKKGSLCEKGNFHSGQIGGPSKMGLGILGRRTEVGNRRCFTSNILETVSISA